MNINDKITTAIVGASRFIKVFLSIDHGWQFSIPIKDLMTISDQRLSLRLLLRGESIDQADHTSLLNSFLIKGWKVRCLEYKATANVILVDNEIAFLSPFPSEDEDEIDHEIKILNDPAEVLWLDDRFDSFWKDSDKITSPIYEDLLILKDIDSKYSILTISQNYWDKIILSLSKTPELMHNLKPRDFERLIAELLNNQGIETHLTPSTKDGGYDILAYQKSAVGKHLYLVECKRYSPNRPVGVGIVRALFGVVEAKRANAGMVVTSSRFSTEAIKESNKIQYRMNLKDFSDIMEWVSDFNLNKRGTEPRH